VSQAADHLRLLKATLKSTFPNINAPVTSTPKQLNSDIVPVGAVMIWPGSLVSIPAGWGYCDGSTYAKLDGSGTIVSPDLRNRFLVCAGSSFSVGTQGGQSSVTPTITTSIAGHALTKQQLPAYNLTVTDSGHIHGVTDPGHRHSFEGSRGNSPLYQFDTGVLWNNGSFNTSTTTTGITVNSATTGITVNSGGSGQTHNHSATSTSSAVSTLPPYRSVIYMMKL
jgi:hypothetical protein